MGVYQGFEDRALVEVWKRVEVQEHELYAEVQEHVEIYPFIL
jgi:hypothetical protein